MSRMPVAPNSIFQSMPFRSRPVKALEGGMKT
jgi:hypothetical protein